MKRVGVLAAVIGFVFCLDSGVPALDYPRGESEMECIEKCAEWVQEVSKYPPGHPKREKLEAECRFKCEPFYSTGG